MTGCHVPSSGDAACTGEGKVGGTMGVLIVYGKDGCEFCDVVIDILNDLLAMVKNNVPGSGLIKLLDCQDGVTGSMHQLTGKEPFRTYFSTKIT